MGIGENEGEYTQKGGGGWVDGGKWGWGRARENLLPIKIRPKLKKWFKGGVW